VGWQVSDHLGRRIAELRVKHGLTQQALAERLAISRVAVSHLESGLSQPGERTVALLASVFRTTPHELVAGTSYPAAKAERLPLVVARYTEVEHQLALLEADLRWCEHVGPPVAEDVLSGWLTRLALLEADTADPGERRQVAGARRLVGRALADQRHRHGSS
jgi:transcriptional regulator with XRE-family HTH domain